MSARRINNTATSRLKQDYLRIVKDPVPYVTAIPLPSNLLEWHYVVCGPESTPYHGGYYHGKLIFPSEFPFKPPSIYMVTPNGRFKCNTRLCLSISDFHPDTWNPAWSVSTILTGLLSFMCEKNPTLGSIETSEFEKRAFAYRSLEHNLQNKTFSELFPDIVKDIQCKLAERADAQATSQQNETSTERVSSGNLAFIDRGFLGATAANVAVIIGIALFAYCVKHVLRTLTPQT